MLKAALAALIFLSLAGTAWSTMYINEQGGTGTVFRDGELVGYYAGKPEGGGTVTFLNGTQAYIFTDAPHGHVYNSGGQALDDYYIEKPGDEERPQEGPEEGRQGG